MPCHSVTHSRHLASMLCGKNQVAFTRDRPEYTFSGISLSCHYLLAKMLGRVIECTGAFGGRRGAGRETCFLLR